MKYFDLHCDTIYRCLASGLDFTDKALSVNAHTSQIFDKHYQCFAIWTPPEITAKSEYLFNSLDFYRKNIFPRRSDSFHPVLTVEGSGFLVEDMSLLSVLKEYDLFSLSLTWNEENAFAGGAYSSAGLKKAGKKVIEGLNKNGVALDLSHLNRKSFFAAASLADNIIASHTFFDALHPHRRNLTIEQIKLIKEKNGLIGLCFYPEFLGTDNILEKTYQAIVFAGDNDFLRNLAIGSDFDGADIPFTAKKLPILYEYLHKKGIDYMTLDLIFYNNAFNYLKELTKRRN